MHARNCVVYKFRVVFIRKGKLAARERREAARKPPASSGTTAAGVMTSPRAGRRQILRARAWRWGRRRRLVSRSGSPGSDAQIALPRRAVRERERSPDRSGAHAQVPVVTGAASCSDCFRCSSTSVRRAHGSSVRASGSAKCRGFHGQRRLRCFDEGRAGISQSVRSSTPPRPEKCRRLRSRRFFAATACGRELVRSLHGPAARSTCGVSGVQLIPFFGCRSRACSASGTCG